jgi:hypothetical protein
MVASFFAITGTGVQCVIARSYDEAISVREWIVLFLAMTVRLKRIIPKK